MGRVIDASYQVGDHAHDLFASGVRTVFRYYTRDSKPNAPKRLRPAEANQLSQAGLRIGAVYEGRRGNEVDNFNEKMGHDDGAFARTYAAREIGQPAGSTIYFAVDVDVTDEEITQRVLPYFTAVHEEMNGPAADPVFDIGVYSCGAVCRALLDKGLVTKTWVSAATKHNGSKAFRASGRWTLDQKLKTIIADIHCDPDVVNGGAGIGDFELSAPSYFTVAALQPMVDDADFSTKLWSANPFNDRASIPSLVQIGASKEGLAKARATAMGWLPGYPHNGCAVHLCALLDEAGIEVRTTSYAGKIALQLEQRGWARIAVGHQMPGDVGVCVDRGPPDGADHVYLVIQTLADNEMLIADNQNSEDAPHKRFATAGHGKTPTDYFLRAV